MAKADEFRQMSPEELRVREREMREQVARLRFQLTAGQSESLKKLRLLKHDIARLLTVRREQERQGK